MLEEPPENHSPDDKDAEREKAEQPQLPLMPPDEAEASPPNALWMTETGLPALPPGQQPEVHALPEPMMTSETGLPVIPAPSQADGGSQPGPAWTSETGLPSISPSARRDRAGASSPDFVWSTDRSLRTYPPWLPEGQARTAEQTTGFGLRLGRVARDLIETVILALLIFVGVRAMVQNFRVEGSSMEGTLHDGQYILVNKAVYFKVDVGFLDFLPFFDAGDNPVHHIFRAPRRGDIIVFRFPNQPERDFIKRVIGEPGDVVEVKDGLVYINGGVLDEDYILERPNYDLGPEVVPEGQYFVLGDNRNNSYDSRSWGFVPEKDIIGRAWISYLPLDDFGLVSNPSVEPMGQGESP